MDEGIISEAMLWALLFTVMNFSKWFDINGAQWIGEYHMQYIIKGTLIFEKHLPIYRVLIEKLCQ